MPKYDVPAIFTVEADNQDEAWNLVRRVTMPIHLTLDGYLPVLSLVDVLVEEPVEVTE